MFFVNRVIVTDSIAAEPYHGKTAGCPAVDRLYIAYFCLLAGKKFWHPSSTAMLLLFRNPQLLNEDNLSAIRAMNSVTLGIL